MRTDELYLRDLLIAADDIAEFLAGYDHTTFLEDRVMRRATPQALTEIGEAANHVSEELKHRYPIVAWDEARAFRNFAVHQYFAIDWSIVWNTATVNVPELRPQIETILAAEFPDAEQQPLIGGPPAWTDDLSGHTLTRRDRGDTRHT